MAAATLCFFLVGTIVPQLGGPALLGVILQGLAAWVAWVAVPVQRFRGLGRAGWWPAVFWGGALFGFGFLLWDLSSRAEIVGMSLRDALVNTEAYVAAIAELAKDVPDEEVKRYLPLSATGWGGISLAMIFLGVQFGWLHFIPGATQASGASHDNS